MRKMGQELHEKNIYIHVTYYLSIFLTSIGKVALLVFLAKTNIKNKSEKKNTKRYKLLIYS